MRRRGFLLMGAQALAARRVAVIAHRGEHRRNTENTLGAVREAVEMGVDYVELDVRTARDGALVLHHDAVVKGMGPVAELTAEEGRLTLFEDALALLRGRCGLYLDWKAAKAEALVAAVRRQGMAERTVVYGAPARLAELRRLAPELRVMPEAVSAEVLARLLVELAPKVVAFDRRDFREDVLRVARAAGVEIFVDRLGDDDTEAVWADAVARGATGIQTDRPAELIAFLKTR